MESSQFGEQMPVCFSDSFYPDIPRFGKVETPSFSVVGEFSHLEKFRRPNYYIRAIPNDSAYSSYELSNSDVDFYEETLPDIPFSQFSKSIDKWEKSSATNPAISKKLALSDCNFKSTAGIEAIYSYWISKRKARKTPLIRNYWKSSDTSDPNLSAVFCRRKNEKMRLRNIKGRESESKLKTFKLLCQLRELKDLIIWVLRRESLKLNIIQLKKMEFEYKRSEVLGLVYNNRNFEEVLRDPVIENSLRFRNPITYLNIYQRASPKVNLKA